jgi:16S rRNA G527 N7-methylase RsmG
MKGRPPADEIEALPEWVKVEKVVKLSVPGLQEDRHLVIMCLSS